MIGRTVSFLLQERFLYSSSMFRFFCILFSYVIVDLSTKKKRVLRVLRKFPVWSPRIQLVTLLVSINCYPVMVT